MSRSSITPAALHILLALSRVPMHGYAIAAEVEERTEGAMRLGPGTLYEALHRMLDCGWIAAASSSDPRRKTYRITPDGVEQLRLELDRLGEIVDFARANKLLSPPRATV